MRSLLLFGLFGSLTASAFGQAPVHPKASTPAEVALSPSEKGWHYVKEDPKTKKRLAVIDAKSWESTSSPFLFKLNGVTGAIYNPASSLYSNLNVPSAFFDAKSGALISGQNLTMISIP